MRDAFASGPAGERVTIRHAGMAPEVQGRGSTMEWKGRRQSSNIEDRRRMSAGRTAGVGGAGAIVIVLIAMFLGVDPSQLLGPGALAALTTAGIGLFHAGVEQGWWDYVSSCTQGSIAGLSASDLLNPAADIAPPARCDQIPWSMFGISMAGWNAIISTGLATIWAFAATRRD